MTEVIVKDLCPHCKKMTGVWLGREDGYVYFRGCQHCDATLTGTPWLKSAWKIVRNLKPKSGE